MKNNSSAGISDALKKSRTRVRRQMVKPQVPQAGSLTLVEAHNEPVAQPSIPQELNPNVNKEKEVVKPKQEKVVVKKKPRSKPSLELKRFEARITPEYQVLVEKIEAKAQKQVHKENNGINKTEIFCGFLNSINSSTLNFSNINFKRGKNYGEATERIKEEVGESIKRASIKTLLEDVISGDSELFEEVFSKLPADKRKKFGSKVSTIAKAKK